MRSTSDATNYDEWVPCKCECAFDLRVTDEPSASNAASALPKATLLETQVAMVAGSKTAPKAKCGAVAKKEKPMTIGCRAQSFRNLMKYRASEQCAKAGLSANDYLTFAVVHHHIELSSLSCRSNGSLSILLVRDLCFQHPYSIPTFCGSVFARSAHRLAAQCVQTSACVF